MENKNKMTSTSNLVKMGVLSALAFVLMEMLEIRLPFFPEFLKIDFGDVPAVIATLVIHPFAGVVVVAMKNLLGLMGSTSGGIGEIANVLVGIAYILPIAIFTKRSGSLKNVIIGSVVGVGLMIIAGMLTNAFITLPLYGEAATIQAGAAINPRIVDKTTFLIYIIAPFNALKGVLVAAASITIVKAAQPMFKFLKGQKATH